MLATHRDCRAAKPPDEILRSRPLTSCTARPTRLLGTRTANASDPLAKPMIWPMSLIHRPPLSISPGRSGGLRHAVWLHTEA